MKIRDYLIRFHSGKANRNEIHQLEKKGIEDPFIGDALEGLRLYQKTNLENKLNTLDNKLESKNAKSKGKISRLWPYAVAASFALLIVLTSVVRNKIGPRTANEITAVDLDELRTPGENVLSDKAKESSFEELQQQLNDFSSTENQESDEASIAELDDEQRIFEDRAIAKSNNETTPLIEKDKPEEPAISVFSKEELQQPSLKTISPSIATQPSADNQLVTSPRSAPVTAEEVGALVVPSAIRAPVDTSGGYPVIGFEKLRQLNMEFKKKIGADLFMRGIQASGNALVTFELDDEGIPFNAWVSSGKGAYLDGLLIEFISSTGKWISTDSSGKISHTVFY